MKFYSCISSEISESPLFTPPPHSFYIKLHTTPRKLFVTAFKKSYTLQYFLTYYNTISNVYNAYRKEKSEDKKSKKKLNVLLVSSEQEAHTKNNKMVQNDRMKVILYDHAVHNRQKKNQVVF